MKGTSPSPARARGRRPGGGRWLTISVLSRVTTPPFGDRSAWRCAREAERSDERKPGFLLSRHTQRKAAAPGGTGLEVEGVRHLKAPISPSPQPPTLHSVLRPGVAPGGAVSNVTHISYRIGRVDQVRKVGRRRDELMK